MPGLVFAISRPQMNKLTLPVPIETIKLTVPHLQADRHLIIMTPGSTLKHD